jgi:multiple sugar transport system permease protein
MTRPNNKDEDKDRDPPMNDATTTRRRPASGQWAAWGFLAPVTIYLGVFYAYPLYRNVDLSLRNYTVRSFVQGDAPFSGLQNYRTVLHDPTFAPALVHTVVFTAVSLVFQYSIGLALAVFFTQHFRLSATLRALFLCPGCSRSSCRRPPGRGCSTAIRVSSTPFCTPSASAR